MKKRAFLHWWRASYSCLFTQGHFKLQLLLFNFQIESLNMLLGLQCSNVIQVACMSLEIVMRRW